jgi:hypothetical protein
MLTTSAPAGNEYEVVVAALTNRTDWPTCEYAPIPRRVHLQLSVDGGSNYTRYIAYGLPVTNCAASCVYSLPWWDETIITERAVVRVTDLEGEQIGRSIEPFTIAGIFIHTPVAGETITHGSYIDLEWVQAGAGDSVQIGYITPTVGFTPVATFTSRVVGTNSLTWQVTGLPYPEEQLRLVLRSVSDPLVWGASGVLEIQ